MTRMTIGALLMCAVTLPASASAQTTIPQAAGQVTERPPAKTTDSPRIVPFLEDTEVHSWLQHELIFEAAFNPHFVFFQNYGDSLVVRNLGSAAPRSTTREFFSQIFSWRNFAITGGIGGIVRMSDELSKPVKTPSYQPRIQVQKLYVNPVGIYAAHDAVESGRRRQAEQALAGVKDAAPDAQAVQALEAKEDELLARGLNVFELHGTLVHHSNGQKGCPVVGQTRVGEDCLPRSIENELNTEDGSFSTNFLRLGSNFRHVVLERVSDVETAAQGIREWTLRLDVDRMFHSVKSPPVDVDDEYGVWRVHASGVFAIRPASHLRKSPRSAKGLALKALRWGCRKRAQASVKATLNPDPPEGVDALAVAATVACYPLERGNWGLFARYYRGQDYYNIHYRSQIGRLQLGIVHSQDGFFRLFRNGSGRAATPMPNGQD